MNLLTIIIGIVAIIAFIAITYAFIVMFKHDKYISFCNSKVEESKISRENARKLTEMYNQLKGESNVS